MEQTKINAGDIVEILNLTGYQEWEFGGTWMIGMRFPVDSVYNGEYWIVCRSRRNGGCQGRGLFTGSQLLIYKRRKIFWQFWK